MITPKYLQNFSRLLDSNKEGDYKQYFSLKLVISFSLYINSLWRRSWNLLRYRKHIPHLIKLANFLRANDSEFVHLTSQSSVALSETSSLMGEKEAILIEIQRRKTLNPSPNQFTNPPPPPPLHKIQRETTMNTAFFSQPRNVPSQPQP